MSRFDDENDENRRRNPFDVYDSDKEFERMIRQIERMIRNSIRESSRNKNRNDDSFVHGFNVKIDSEGNARIKEFNGYPGHNKKYKTEREPVVDVIEDKNDVSVTIEIPGVKKEDVDLNVVDNIFEIKLSNPLNRFHKKIALPCKVKPETTEAVFNNGLLDVVIKKENIDDKENGFHVNIK
jgi:HSP20 family protein